MTEDQLEQEALGWLADVGYQHRYGPELAPDGSTVRLQEKRLEPRVRFPPNSIRLQAFISLWRDLEYAS